MFNSVAPALYDLCYDVESQVLTEELAPDFGLCHFQLYVRKPHDWQ